MIKLDLSFFPLGRAFHEGLDKTIPNYQEEGVIKLLKEIRDNLGGVINIPAGLIIPAGPPGPQGPILSVPLEPPPIIPKLRTPSPQMTRLRPKLPSEKRKTDYDDIDKRLGDSRKRLDDSNKVLNDILNNIKNKKLRNLAFKKMNDTVDSPDIDPSPKINFSPDFESLRKTVDEINKSQSDQINYDKLMDMMNKINSSD